MKGDACVNTTQGVQLRGGAAGGVDNVPVAHFDGSTIVHNPIEFIVDPALTDHRTVALERQRIMSWWAAFTP